MSEENNMKNEVNSIGNSAKIDLAKTDEYNPYMGNPQENEDIQKIATSVLKIKTEIGKTIIGQNSMIDLMLTALLTNGHVLLEGVPGIAKTLSSKLLAQTISTSFSRIQFTPDLMPTDIIGTSVFNMKTSEFNFKPGPVFSNVILIDEINRAPAKTQAALMEVMEEEQITVDGNTYAMGFPFFVIATQNPVEQEGTYKLPEAQLDRFMFRILIEYPTAEEEKEILMRFKNDFYTRQHKEIAAILSPEELKNCRSIIESVYIKDELIKYIAEIVSHTRNNPDLYLGASPRASLAILKACKARAVMNGRFFVTPDDIKSVVFPALNHRVVLSHEREMEGLEVGDIIDEILQKIEVPR